ncbi:MAG: GNAT family N-acetyltransferase [endosymbiont of Galathealinum brachiosum]|uniref:GNAT family N-acetyltransferase n=1 Tax=endosymbiont of Galathealinum brachiosum TaxID=2200906 RepID=A0A370DMK0_9GAMM|nr:MAG: GNAT family N-acetyltransferase [endosymbiont of Galathealinum brachiosum]
MNYNIQVTSWEKDKSALSKIRQKVFIEEQNVPEELEWDDDDKNCVHVLVTHNNTPIATGRIKMDGHIGRIAVLKNYRDKGIGSAVLKALIDVSKTLKIKSIYLHAQIGAISFYEKHGFKISSEEFMDAGIPHKTMKMDL